MAKITVKLAGDGSYSVLQGEDPMVNGLSLDEAENYSVFVRAARRVRCTRMLPEMHRTLMG